MKMPGRTVVHLYLMLRPQALPVHQRIVMPYRKEMGTRRRIRERRKRGRTV
jgi:hypothetical protein